MSRASRIACYPCLRRTLLVLCAALAACTPMIQRQQTPTPVGSASSIPRGTPIPSTATLVPPPTPPTPPTRAPLDPLAISPDTASAVVQRHQLGLGRLETVAWSPDGGLLAVATSLGLYVYDASAFTLLRLTATDVGGVVDTTFSPDGRLLASAGENGDIQLWDAATGELVRTFRGHEAEAGTSVAFSPDGRTLAASRMSYRHTPIEFWDVATGEPLPGWAAPAGFGSSIASMRFSPDGRWLASEASDDNHTVQLWDAAAGQVLHTFEGSQTGFGFSPDSALLAAVISHTVQLWDLNQQELLRPLAPRADATSVAISPSGEQVAIGCSDGRIELWDPVRGVRLWTLTGHAQGVGTLAFNADGSLLASGSADATVRLWNPETGKPVHTFAGHTATVWSVGFAPGGAAARLVSWGRDGSVRTWDTDGLKPFQALQGYMGSVFGVAFSPDNSTLATGSWDYQVHLWDARSGLHERALGGHTWFVFGVAYSPDGGLLAAAGGDATVRMWDAATGGLTATLTISKTEGRPGWIDTVLFSPGGQYLAARSDGGVARVWDVASRRVASSFDGVYELIAFTKAPPCRGTAEPCLVISTASGVEWRGAQTGELWARTELPPGTRPQALSPDGQLLAASSSSGPGADVVYLVGTSSGRILQTFEVQGSAVDEIAFSPDGHVLASGNSDKSVRLWDVATGTLLKTLIGHQDYIAALAFSPDGHMLASASPDGTARLWALGTP